MMVHNEAQKMPGHVELRGRDPSQRHAHNEITFTALDKGQEFNVRDSVPCPIPEPTWWNVSTW